MFARRRWPVSLVVAIVCLLAGAAVAVASSFSPPVLRAPRNGQHVHAGRVTLLVYDPGVPADVRPLFVTISSKRTVDKFGHLKIDISRCKHCDFVSLRPVKRHPGLWSYTAHFNFPGYWAVTPGKYYWQANHVAERCQAPECEVVSEIHTFRIVG
jgi:hypothetical protein